MAIRLTPGGGSNASVGQRIGAGLFAGLGDLGDLMQKRNLANEADRRTTARTLLKDYTDKVMSGALEPQQAAAAMQSQGFRVPASYFTSLQPSVNREMKGITSGITEAKTPQEVVGRTALADSPVLKRVPFKSKLTAVPGQPDESVDSGQTLPSKRLDQFSPEFDRLMQIRTEKLNAFEPKQLATVDAEGNKQIQFESANPETLTGRTFRAEPTPQQAGQRKGTESLAEQAAKLAGQFGTNEGVLESQKLDASRGAQARTAGATSRASTQGRLDVENAPGNVQAEAARQAAITTATTTARDDAMRAGIPPEIAQNYIHGTLTNKSYAYVPSEVPSLERSVIIRELASKGIHQFDKSTTEGIANIQKARAQYKDLVDIFATRVAADPKGRPYAAANNKLAIYLQTDPALAAAVAEGFPQVINLLKANAGTVGRIMEVELRNMQNVLPLPTDTLQAVRQKQLRVAMMLKRAEDAAFSDYGQ